MFIPIAKFASVVLVLLASSSPSGAAIEPFAGSQDDARVHPTVSRNWPIPAVEFLKTHFFAIPQASLWRGFNSVFLEPNERQPIDGIRLFESAPEGVHVGVGTERVLFGALLNPNASHILMFDLNPSAVAYFRVNAALLELSTDHRDYLDLRLRTDVLTLRNRAEAAWASGQLSTVSRDAVRDLTAEPVLEEMRRAEFRFVEGSTVLFRGVNYLADPRLYQRLAAFAKTGRIAAITASFSVERERQLVIAAVARNGLRIGLLDLSNAWIPGYSSWELSPFLAAIQPHTASNSRLVLTHWSSSDHRPWRYFGFSLERLHGTTRIEQGLERALVQILRHPQGVLDPPEALQTILLVTR